MAIRNGWDISRPRIKNGWKVSSPLQGTTIETQPQLQPLPQVSPIQQPSLQTSLTPSLTQQPLQPPIRREPILRAPTVPESLTFGRPPAIPDKPSAREYIEAVPIAGTALTSIADLINITTKPLRGEKLTEEEKDKVVTDVASYVIAGSFIRQGVPLVKELWRQGGRTLGRLFKSEKLAKQFRTTLDSKLATISDDDIVKSFREAPDYVKSQMVRSKHVQDALRKSQIVKPGIAKPVTKPIEPIVKADIKPIVAKPIEKPITPKPVIQKDYWKLSKDELKKSFVDDDRIVGDRITKLKSDSDSIHSQMKILEEQKERFRRLGQSTGNIDTQIDKLGKRFQYTEGEMGNLMTERVKMESIMNKPAELKVQDIIGYQRRAANIAKKEAKETYLLHERIKKQPIRNMGYEERVAIEELKKQKPRTLGELKSLSQQITDLKNIGKKKYIDSVEGDSVRHNYNKSILISKMKKLDKPEHIGIEPTKKSKFKVFRAETLTPSRIFDKLDDGANFEGNNNKFFYHRPNSMEDVKLNNIDKRISSMESKMKDLGIEEKDMRVIIKVGDLDIATDKVLSFYTAMKNGDKLAAIIYGNKISGETIREGVSKLPPNIKKLGDEIIKDYTENQPRIRQANLDYTNGREDVGFIEDYTPIRRTMVSGTDHQDEIAKEILERKRLRKAFTNKDFTKRRFEIKEENQMPIRLGELSLWKSEVEKQEHFMAFGKLTKEMQRMVGDKDFANTVRTNYGEEYLSAIQGYVNRIGDPNIYKSHNQAEKTLSVLRQNAAVAYLGINFMTMGKQFPSIALFLQELSITEILSGIKQKTVSPKKTAEFIYSLAPQMKHRSLERTLEELKVTDSRKYAEIVKKLGRKSMAGIYAVDRFVTHSGWIAAYNKYTIGENALSSKAAAEKATRLVMRNQPAAHAKDISGIYAKNEYANLFLQFTNQLNKIYNIVTYDIPASASQGRYLDAIRGGAGVALAAWMIASLEERKPLLAPSEIAKGLTRQAVGYIPVVGRSIISASKGFDFTSIPAFKGIEAAAKTVDYAFKGDIEKFIPKAIESIFVLGGIPYAQPRRIIKYFKGE